MILRWGAATAIFWAVVWAGLAHAHPMSGSNATFVQSIQGRAVAPFMHGWYWENPGDKDVTIKLTTAGFYGSAQEFFDGRSFSHELTDVRGQASRDTK